MDTIIEQSEIYASQHNRINFLLTEEELKLFIGVLLLSGYHKLPHKNKYWEQVPDEFGKFGVFHSELSTDEIMVHYYGKHSAKMFLRGKPMKFGYKIWCLTSSNGFLYNFSPYCGKTDNKQEPLGARVINELTSMIPESEYPNYKLFFDDFFTSVDTLITLGKSKMKAAGTITEIRTNACPLIDSKRMAKGRNEDSMTTYLTKRMKFWL
ncbi:piggyBac transposable element-derived protein 2-like [Schistocerca piceifrons]|uniref:piggyBac transposable element-derived protein 2-like n=1 Tax=Schistocerca piceifrons TaxID=274613 RepID=UPI001F5F4A22|nr:piggyBac transposable element-derived protein 2-like [Schistocerca piceifrons]